VFHAQQKHKIKKIKRFVQCFFLAKFETNNIWNNVLFSLWHLMHENIKRENAVNVVDLSWN